MASPLANIATGNVDALPSYMDMFIGNIPGCLGETSAWPSDRRILSDRQKSYLPIIPVTYIGTSICSVRNPRTGSCCSDPLRRSFHWRDLHGNQTM